MKGSILCIGDMHLPFVDTDSVKAIYKASKELQPKAIVQLGDIYDLFSFGRFPRSLDVMNPEDEVAIARKMAEQFWNRLQKDSPKSKCYQIKGNHDERPKKKLLSNFPEMSSILNIDWLWEFDSVNTQPSERDELILDGIVFMHGYRSKLGDHARHNNMSTVCGHSHTGGTAFIRTGNQTIWELNCGFIGDATSTPLSYTRQRRISRWTQGFGIIDKYGPRFVPLKNKG